MGRKTIALFAVLTAFLFVVACSSSDDSSSSSSSSSAANVPGMPADVPLYPGAVAVNGYTLGPLTQLTYEIAAAPADVRVWYSANMPSLWGVDKDWFAFGRGQGDSLYQRHHTTADFNQNPSARAGKQVVLGVGPDTEGSGGTQLTVMYTDYS